MTEHSIASRSRRFWAFSIDQIMLSLASVVVFIAVFATQTEQLSNATSVIFGDPVWGQSGKLSSQEFNSQVETLFSSERVVTSVEALAHPFALALGLSLLFSVAYYVIPTNRWGATLGKYWLKIKVRNLDGTLPDFSHSSARYFAFIGLGTFGGIVTILDLVVNKAFVPSNTAVDILTLLLSQATWIISVVCIVLINVRIDHRGLHDILAKTIVYDVAKEPKKQ